MISEKKKSYSKYKKQSSSKLDKVIMFPLRMLGSQCQRNSLTLSKNNKLSSQNKSFQKTHKSKSHLRTSLNKLEKNEKNLILNKKIRPISRLSQKLSNQRSSKSQEKKNKKYIFNILKDDKNQNNQTMKQRNLASTLHSKSFSNQTLIRNTCYKSSFALNNSSKNEVSKIKKKKNAYAQNFTKTSCLQKSLSTGFDSVGYSLSQTIDNLNMSKNTLKKAKRHQNLVINQQQQQKLNFNSFKLLLNSTKYNNEQFQKLKKNHQKKLNQIHSNAHYLIKKLKNPQRNRLTLAVNNYQKIVSQLYNVIANQCTFPDSQIFKVNTNKSNQHENKNKSAGDQNSSIFYGTQINNIQRKVSNLGGPTMEDQQKSESQHWDSYLELQDKNNKNSLKKSLSQKINIVKKLNLDGVRNSSIKEYHEQFMEMKQFFSDSWKRQLQLQKKI